MAHEALCQRLGCREQRFSTFLPGAHCLAGETDRRTRDFWSEGTGASTAHSEARSLLGGKDTQEPARADEAWGTATLEAGVAA